MKNLINILLISLLTVQVYCQKNKKVNDSIQVDSTQKFLFSSYKFHLSTFYLETSPSSNLFWVNGQLEAVSSLTLGLIFNRKFFFGLFSDSSPKLNRIPVPEVGTQKRQNWIDAGVELDRLTGLTDTILVNYTTAGLHLGYIHANNKFYFWRAGVRLGLTGGVKLSENKSFLGLFDNAIYKTNVITIAPELGGGLTLLRWLRIYLDIGYRWVLSEDIGKVVTAEDYDSPTFRIGLAFGGFQKP